MRPVSDSPDKRSGMLPRRRTPSPTNEPPPDPQSNSMTSQMRRRWELEDEEAETQRFVPPRSGPTPSPSAASTTASFAGATAREPGFVEEDPEEGIPTPRPRMAMTAVPERAVSDRELMTLPLDHRAGFVLSHVDGATDLRTLIDVCGMDHDELVGVVERLVALRAIRLV